MSLIAPTSAHLTHSAVSSGLSVYDNALYNILVSALKPDVITENRSYPFAHEASAYIYDEEELLVSSNFFTDPVTNQIYNQDLQGQCGRQPRDHRDYQHHCIHGQRGC